MAYSGSSDHQPYDAWSCIPFGAGWRSDMSPSKTLTPHPCPSLSVTIVFAKPLSPSSFWHLHQQQHSSVWAISCIGLCAAFCLMKTVFYCCSVRKRLFEPPQRIKCLKSIQSPPLTSFSTKTYLSQVHFSSPLLLSFQALKGETLLMDCSAFHLHLLWTAT